MMPCVLVAQLGARMHYAVPRILHEAGALDRFFTDICATGAWARALGALPAGIVPPGAAPSCHAPAGRHSRRQDHRLHGIRIGLCAAPHTGAHGDRGDVEPSPRRAGVLRAHPGQGLRQCHHGLWFQQRGPGAAGGGPPVWADDGPGADDRSGRDGGRPPARTAPAVSRLGRAARRPRCRGDVLCARTRGVGGGRSDRLRVGIRPGIHLAMRRAGREMRRRSLWRRSPIFPAAAGTASRGRSTC